MVFMFKIYITVSKSPCYLLTLTFVSFQYLSPFASGVDSPTFQLFHLIGLLHVVELLHLLVEVNHVDLKEFVLNFEAMNFFILKFKKLFFICSGLCHLRQQQPQPVKFQRFLLFEATCFQTGKCHKI